MNKDKRCCDEPEYRFVRRDKFKNLENFVYMANMHICQTCGTVLHLDKEFTTDKAK